MRRAEQKKHTCDIPPPARKNKERREQIRIPGVFAPGYDGPLGTPDATNPNEDHAGTIGNNGKLVGEHPGVDADMVLEDHSSGHGVVDDCEVDVFDHVMQEM